MNNIRQKFAGIFWEREYLKFIKQFELSRKVKGNFESDSPNHLLKKARLKIAPYDRLVGGERNEPKERHPRRPRQGRSVGSERTVAKVFKNGQEIPWDATHNELVPRLIRMFFVPNHRQAFE